MQNSSAPLAVNLTTVQVSEGFTINRVYDGDIASNVVITDTLT